MRKAHLKRGRSGSANLVIRNQPKLTFPRQIERLVRRLYGEPCWGVKPGVGSFLTLEFGKPICKCVSQSSQPRALPRAFDKLWRAGKSVHGEWHLWIYCCHWEVLSGNKRIGDSSTKTKMRCAAEFLLAKSSLAFRYRPEMSIACLTSILAPH